MGNSPPTATASGSARAAKREGRRGRSRRRPAQPPRPEARGTAATEADDDARGDNDDDDDADADVDGGGGGWSCHLCDALNPAARRRCSKCLGWRGGRRDDIRASGGGKKASPAASSDWTCHRCSRANASSRKRCSACQAWRGGKREGYSSSPPRKKRRTGAADAFAAERSKVERRRGKGDEDEDQDGGGRRRRRTVGPARGGRGRSRGSDKRRREGGAVADAFRDRRSNTSRRPRRLRPTEKMMASIVADSSFSAPGDVVGDGRSSSGTGAPAAGARKKKRRRVDDAPPPGVGKARREDTAVDAAKAGGARRRRREGTKAGRNDGGSTTGGKVDRRDDDDGDDGKHVDAADDDEEDIDDVACALCKCAVDFSDLHFFLPSERGGGDGPVVLKGAATSRSTADEAAGNEGTAMSPLTADGSNRQEIQGECFGDTGPNRQHCASANGDGDGDGDDDDDDSSSATAPSDDGRPPFRLPRRFHDPNNALMLCDGPVHAAGAYRCERAFHQRCHFDVPVLSIPRGPWRCLICKFRDEAYLRRRRKASPGRGGGKCNGSGGGGGGAGAIDDFMSDAELSSIFRVEPVVVPLPKEGNPAGADPAVKEPASDRRMTERRGDDIASPVELAAGSSRSDATIDEKRRTIAALERRFESISAPLKSRLLHAELTTKSRGLIKSSLSTIRTAQHSLRSFTETSKARKALAERIFGSRLDNGLGLGLPQEVCQCVMRIAVAKTKVSGLIRGLEGFIRCRPGCLEHLSPLELPGASATNGKSPCEAANGSTHGDVLVELMQWYRNEQKRKMDNDDSAIAAAKASEGAIMEIQQATSSVDVTETTMGQSLIANGKSACDLGDTGLLYHIFPEGEFNRRRHAPRTDEVKDSSNAGNNDDDEVSLDNLTCSICHLSHASDTNDMLLCDGIGCYRAFHMECLEPKLTPQDVNGSEDEDWFCPLCTAHAELIHYAQCEYLGDDWEELINNGVKEWETANDVFPEAEFEMRVAQKFKDGIMDEDTCYFLEDSLGIVAAGKKSKREDMQAESNLLALESSDEEDDDFDQEEELEDCGSLSSDDEMERRLAKDKIAKDELDALSVDSETGGTSSDEDDSDGGSDGEGDDDTVAKSSVDSSSSAPRSKPPRRSKRRRFQLPDRGLSTSGDDDDSDSAAQPKDVGRLDISNIVRGKRNRTKVDYRKLADAMFGDESDDEAKGAKREYIFNGKPKHMGNDRSSDDEEGDDDSSSESGNESD